MKRIAPWILILTLMATVWAMAQQRQSKERTDPRQKELVLRIITEWLECEECTEGQLDKVVEMGSTAVPTLRAVLAKGPSQTRRGELQQHLKETYRKMQAHAKKNPDVKLPMSEREYISTYMDNYSALHQSRAAKALGKIGGRDAEQALQTASSARLRGDVGKVVRDALNEARRKQRQQQRPRRRR